MRNENEKIGVKLAQDLRWDGCEILEIAGAALEDANFHKEARTAGRR